MCSLRALPGLVAGLWMAMAANGASAAFVSVDLSGKTDSSALPALERADVGSITGMIERKNVSFAHDVVFRLEQVGTANVAGAKVTVGDLVDIRNLGYQVLGITDLVMAPDLLVTSLMAGFDYTLRITGTTGGRLGGNYKVDIAITPVPAAVMLLGPALAGLGIAGLRRRPASPA